MEYFAPIWDSKAIPNLRCWVSFNLSCQTETTLMKASRFVALVSEFKGLRVRGFGASGIRMEGGNDCIPRHCHAAAGEAHSQGMQGDHRHALKQEVHGLDSPIPSPLQKPKTFDLKCPLRYLHPSSSLRSHPRTNSHISRRIADRCVKPNPCPERSISKTRSHKNLRS